MIPKFQWIQSSPLKSNFTASLWLGGDSELSKAISEECILWYILLSWKYLAYCPRISPGKFKVSYQQPGQRVMKLFVHSNLKRYLTNSLEGMWSVSVERVSTWWKKWLSLKYWSEKKSKAISLSLCAGNRASESTTHSITFFHCGNL